MAFKKLPKRFMGIVLPFILTFFMTCFVSGISVLRSQGLGGDFFRVWPSAWMISWGVAFPVMVTVLPFVKKIVGRIVEE